MLYMIEIKQRAKLTLSKSKMWFWINLNYEKEEDISGCAQGKVGYQKTEIKNLNPVVKLGIVLF